MFLSSKTLAFFINQRILFLKRIVKIGLFSLHSTNYINNVFSDNGKT